MSLANKDPCILECSLKAESWQTVLNMTCIHVKMLCAQCQHASQRRMPAPTQASVWHICHGPGGVLHVHLAALCAGVGAKEGHSRHGCASGWHSAGLSALRFQHGPRLCLQTAPGMVIAASVSFTLLPSPPPHTHTCMHTLIHTPACCSLICKHRMWRVCKNILSVKHILLGCPMTTELFQKNGYDFKCLQQCKRYFV